jgi:hypothetical protein
VRPLLVVAAALAMMVPGQSRAASIAPHSGQTITQTELLAYLFTAPQPGDWVRYEIRVDGKMVETKTVGFGVETLDATPAAFFEIQTQTPALLALPESSQQIAGGNIAWKLYVDAPDFNDSLRRYTIAAGIIKVGDAYFRLGGSALSPLPSYRQTLQSLLLFGLLSMPDGREGVVAGSQPEDMYVAGRTVPVVDTTVDFSARGLGGSTGLPPARVEAWQTTDVPLGLVAIKLTQGGSVFSMTLTACGRRSYRAVITRGIDTLPYFPGS